MRAFSRIHGAAVLGAGAHLVDVQVAVDLREELDRSSFRIVGLPDSALREGRDRIRNALDHAGWGWHARWVVVNLAPAALRKQGAALDLPIAMAILGATGALGTDAQITGDADASTRLTKWLCLGELGLDGAVRGVRGVLAAVESARRAGVTCALVPEANATEAAAVSGMHVVAVDSVVAAAGHLSGRDVRPRFAGTPWRPAPWAGESRPPVRGQPVALAAGWVAAAGGHNLLLSGPPGSGKTLLARHLAAVLPPLTTEEALEVSRVWSVAGLLDGGLLPHRPFRAPHHSTSRAGLVGGGPGPSPGEVSLAHRGVLFLDELAEFPRRTLESLRQPLEDGALTIGRAQGRARFPSRVVLIAATNPCPCGWRGVGDRCTCSRRQVEAYQARISGPLRDRFDIEIVMRPVDPERLVGPPPDTPFTPDAVRGAWRAQAERARRLGLADGWNARLPAEQLPGAAGLETDAERMLVAGAERFGLSARAIHRVVRVSRTIADLDGSEPVRAPHVSQAIGFRTASA